MSQQKELRKLCALIILCLVILLCGFLVYDENLTDVWLTQLHSVNNNNHTHYDESTIVELSTIETQLQEPVKVEEFEDTKANKTKETTADIARKYTDITHITHNGTLLFNYSCNSFPVLCNKMHLQNIYNLDDFNARVDAINNELILKNISRLFILSFRREFMFMLNAYNVIPKHNISNNIYYTILTKLTAPNHSPHLSLLHTHISKAMGTTLAGVALKISKSLNIKSMMKGRAKKIGWNASDMAYTGNSKYYLKSESCKHLYQRIVENNKQYRIETEKPLTNYMLCPQFYNSIVLREPISHRLSLLSFKNFLGFRHDTGGILCLKQFKQAHVHKRRPIPGKIKRINNIIDWRNYSFCVDANAYAGFINILFNKSNIGNLANEQRILNQEIIPYHDWHNLQSKAMKNETDLLNEKDLLIEWISIDSNNKRFAIEHILTNGYHAAGSQNTSCWMGFLSNTYVRWLGYKHKDARVVMDALYESVFNINQWHLYESKRILLQYDYVLPSSASQSGTVWMFYLKEIHRIIMQIRSVEQFLHELKNGTKGLIINRWNERSIWSRANTNRQLSTSLLYKVFEGSGELSLLQKLNALDNELYKYSIEIAKVDEQFYQILYQITNISFVYYL